MWVKCQNIFDMLQILKKCDENYYLQDVEMAGQRKLYIISYEMLMRK